MVSSLDLIRFRHFLVGPFLDNLFLVEIFLSMCSKAKASKIFYPAFLWQIFWWLLPILYWSFRRRLSRLAINKVWFARGMLSILSDHFSKQGVLVNRVLTLNSLAFYHSWSCFMMIVWFLIVYFQHFWWGWRLNILSLPATLQSWSDFVYFLWLV